MRGPPTALVVIAVYSGHKRCVIRHLLRVTCGGGFDFLWIMVVHCFQDGTLDASETQPYAELNYCKPSPLHIQQSVIKVLTGNIKFVFSSMNSDQEECTTRSAIDSIDIDDHIHCIYCFRINCQYSRCAMRPCPECYAMLHACKLEDHLLICPKVDFTCFVELKPWSLKVLNWRLLL